MLMSASKVYSLGDVTIINNPRSLLKSTNTWSGQNYFLNGVVAGQDEGSFLLNFSTINCVGSGISCTGSGQTLTITVTGGGGSGGGGALFLIPPNVSISSLALPEFVFVNGSNVSTATIKNSSGGWTAPQTYFSSLSVIGIDSLFSILTSSSLQISSGTINMSTGVPTARITWADIGGVNPVVVDLSTGGQSFWRMTPSSTVSRQELFLTAGSLEVGLSGGASHFTVRGTPPTAGSFGFTNSQFQDRTGNSAFFFGFTAASGGHGIISTTGSGFREMHISAGIDNASGVGGGLIVRTPFTNAGANTVSVTKKLYVGTMTTGIPIEAYVSISTPGFPTTALVLIATDTDKIIYAFYPTSATFNISSMTLFQTSLFVSSPISNGFIFNQDGRLIGVNQSAGSGGGTGTSDNFGSHVATQQVNMGNFPIVNTSSLVVNMIAANSTTSTWVNSTELHAVLGIFQTFAAGATGNLNGLAVTFPSIQAAGCLQNDGFGVWSWVACSGGSGSSDNLGSHVATQTINMAGFTFSNTTGAVSTTNYVVTSPSMTFVSSLTVTQSITSGGNQQGQSVFTDGLIINNAATGASFDDFQVKSDANDFMLYMKASTNKFGINVSSPSSIFDVVDGSVTIRGNAAGLNMRGGNVPPSGQALCFDTNGNLGHCTSVVGVGGGCTCVAP